MKRRFILALLLSLPFFLPAIGASQAQQGGFTLQQLTGIYRVDGLNERGRPYSGEVNITVRNNVAFFVWEISRQSYTGRGVIQNNRLVVDWGSSAPVIYTIDQFGNLNGTWANGQASERLTRLQ